MRGVVRSHVIMDVKKKNNLESFLGVNSFTTSAQVVESTIVPGRRRQIQLYLPSHNIYNILYKI